MLTPVGSIFSYNHTPLVGGVLERGFNFLKNGELWTSLLLIYGDNAILIAENGMLGKVVSAFVEMCIQTMQVGCECC